MDAHRAGGSRVSLAEVLAILVLWGMTTVGVFVAYTRVPVDELYEVSKSGPRAAAGRVLVYWNFPIAFVAIAVLGFALARLWEGGKTARGWARRVVELLAAVALLLCLVAGFPGVVDSHDLDARPINAMPAIGVAIAAALFVVAWRRGGGGARSPWQRKDNVRFALVVVLAVLALPWILAEFGFYIGDIPGLGHVFMSKQIVNCGDRVVAVHLGGHHGFDGAAMAITGLVLSRAVGTLRRGWARVVLGLYVALLIAYGVANGVQDFWGEQVVKRGWATSEIPSMYRPRIAPEWGLVLIGIVVVYLLLIRSRETGDALSTPARKGTEPTLPSRRGAPLAR